MHAGTYVENVDVNKQLTLRGIDMPVVDAGRSGDVITISADGVVVEGFMATKSGYMGYAGIKVTSNNNTITGNTVSNNVNGIDLGSWSSSNNAITGNTVSNNNGYGIYLHISNNNTITGNTVSNNVNGIDLGSWSSNNNTITGNTVSNNDWDSIRLGGHSNTITGNTCVNDGLYVWYSYQNTVEDNTVNGKPLVYLEDTSDIEVTDAGQVILVNCNNITVGNLDLSNTNAGI